MMIKVPSHVEIDVRRPSGVTETIRPARTQMSPREFQAIKDATAKAGRGECLAFRNVTKEIPQPAEYAELAKSDREWDESRKAVYRAMDAEDETEAADRTPVTKSDMD